MVYLMGDKYMYNYTNCLVSIKFVEDDLYAAHSREWKRFEIPRRVNDLGTLMGGKGNDYNSGEKRIVQ